MSILPDLPAVNVTFPDGTTETIHPYPDTVSYVVAACIDGRWHARSGFSAGEVAEAHAEADRLRSLPRYDATAVLEVDR